MADDSSIIMTSSNTSVATVNQDGVITALHPGETVISVKTNDGGFTAQCAVRVDSKPEFEMVDLGLTVVWASWNVGASYPEDYGDYFAWGETEPYYEIGYSQSECPVWKKGKENGYDWPSYALCNGNISSIIKYGKIDGKVRLEPDDDAAHSHWGESGQGWRMPTRDECLELHGYCKWEWTQRKGVFGWLVTREEIGKSIFLPAAGFWSEKNYILKDINYGSRPHYSKYWTSDMAGEYLAYQLNDGQYQNLDGDYYHYRIIGLPIRPVFSCREQPVVY